MQCLHQEHNALDVNNVFLVGLFIDNDFRHEHPGIFVGKAIQAELLSFLALLLCFFYFDHDLAIFDEEISWFHYHCVCWFIFRLVINLQIADVEFNLRLRFAILQDGLNFRNEDRQQLSLLVDEGHAHLVDA
jgi:hypothetical protein